MAAVAPGCCIPHDSLSPALFQAYIKIYQGEELPHPKSMLQVGVSGSSGNSCTGIAINSQELVEVSSTVGLLGLHSQMPECNHPRSSTLGRVWHQEPDLAEESYLGRTVGSCWLTQPQPAQLNDSLQVNDILGATQGGDTWKWLPEPAGGCSWSCLFVAEPFISFLAGSHS